MFYYENSECINRIKQIVTFYHHFICRKSYILWSTQRKSIFVQDDNKLILLQYEPLNSFITKIRLTDVYNP